MKNLKIVFFRVGWMNHYQGIKNDKIIGGGRYPRKVGEGGEIYNFRPVGKWYFGYVRPKTLNISRIGKKFDKDTIKNVLVVWVAKRPGIGQVVVGWSKDATVFRKSRYINRRHAFKFKKGNTYGYHVISHVDDTILLNPEQRIFPVIDFFGRSHVKYADFSFDRPMVKNVLEYIKTGKLPRTKHGPATGTPRQPDQLKKIVIETKAYKIFMRHFEDLNFIVEEKYKENKGWDLEASYMDIRFLLEVKGLSGTFGSIELTPNEFKQMKLNKHIYKLCISSNTLSKKPQKTIISYSSFSKQWEDEGNRKVNIKIIRPARVSY
jgi:hypothetical protein